MAGDETPAGVGASSSYNFFVLSTTETRIYEALEYFLEQYPKCEDYPAAEAR